MNRREGAACWIRVSWALLLCVACGDERSREPPATGELPPGAQEIDPSQAPSSMGPSIEEAALESTPASERADTRYQSFLDALDRNFRLRCECQYAALGHPSAEVCFERLRTPDFAKACALRAFALYADDLGNRYACLGRLRETSSACIEARGCEALAE